jgi:acetyl-CoA C-acetyltransferase
MLQMRDVVIVEGCRTAIGAMNKSLKPLHANELAAVVMNEVVRRAGIDKSMVDEVILGQCRQTSDESNMARFAALRAGFPVTTSGQTVMRQCASAMTAVQTGMMEVAAGLADIVIAGGAESMSNGVFYLTNARHGLGTGNVEFKDAVTEGQFQCQPNEIYGRFNMGMTAENVAEMMKISREDQDKLALMSQQRASAAIKAGKFKDEIVPVTVPQGKKKDPIIFDTDEFVRHDATLEALAKLKPVFREGGTVTAGNSSGRNDAAAVVLMMTAEKAKELGLKPICRIIGIGLSGVDPRYMRLGPVEAAPKALKMSGLTGTRCPSRAQRRLPSRHWASYGSLAGKTDGQSSTPRLGISLGHPIGCTAASSLSPSMYELRRRNAQFVRDTLHRRRHGPGYVIEML